MNQIRLATRKASIRTSPTAFASRHRLSTLATPFQPCNDRLNSSHHGSALSIYSSNKPTRYFSSDGIETSHEDVTADDTTVPTDSSIEDLFGVEYKNAWLGLTFWLDETDLDKSSRFLIQQLQDLYHGIVQKFDRPTTEQCNKILNNIAHHASEKRQVEVYAFRADDILRCMQLFFNILPQDLNVRLPYPLPLPNRETYVLVLTLYSKAKHLSANKGPLRCQEIVQQMKEHSILAGDLNLQPIAHDYNKVLLAWGTSRSPKKSFSAANFLQELKKEGLHDDQSYTHVLRACAFSKFEDVPQAQRLAANVAVKVYHDMVKNNVECTPLTYSYFLRACVFLENETERDQEVEEAFRKCRSEGNVDDTILLRLRNVASLPLWKQLMGKLASNESIKARDLPVEWTRNVETE